MGDSQPRFWIGVDIGGTLGAFPCLAFDFAQCRRGAVRDRDEPDAIPVCSAFGPASVRSTHPGAARCECRHFRRSHHPAQLGVGDDIVHGDVAATLLEAGEPAT